MNYHFGCGSSESSKLTARYSGKKIRLPEDFFKKEISLEDTESNSFDGFFAGCFDCHRGLQKENRTPAGGRTSAGFVGAGSYGAIDGHTDGDFSRRPGATELEDDERDQRFH
jgi:hypothetical protein